MLESKNLGAINPNKKTEPVVLFAVTGSAPAVAAAQSQETTARTPKLRPGKRKENQNFSQQVPDNGHISNGTAAGERY